ncbi:MAG: hypothetical protein IKV30_03935 [Clostridia bacterium]|nr:hypothetical protein [Clostridia bacterium]
MFKKIMAIIALIVIVALMLDVFVLHYALEIVLPIYIILTVAGLIFLVYSKSGEATRRANEARRKAEGNDSDANTLDTIEDTNE